MGGTLQDKLRKSRDIPGFILAFMSGQFLKYLAAGALAFGTEYGLYFFLFRCAGLFFLTANIFAMTAGFAVSFLLNRYWSFRSRDPFFNQLIKYTGLFIINLFLSSSLIYLATKYAGLSPLLSKILVMGLIVLWNYVLYKKIIYRS